MPSRSIVLPPTSDARSAAGSPSGGTSAPSSKPHPLWLAANLRPPASSVAPVPPAQGLPASLAVSVFAARSGPGLQDGALDERADPHLLPDHRHRPIDRVLQGARVRGNGPHPD